MKKTQYQDRKARARDLAINWQNDFCNRIYGWADLADWAGRWMRIGRRYGLLREFRENGIL